MIVVDASAVCAILLDEPEKDELAAALARLAPGFISPVQTWEAAVTVTGRRGGDGMSDVENFLARTDLSVRAIDMNTARLAFSAWRSFGKGRHPARLNLGDCFAYALAKSRNLPLLYKGEDFRLTDLKSAL